MPETVTDRYGVPLPLDVLLAAIEARYGSQARTELEAIYATARQRYARAERLTQFERDLARASRTPVTMDAGRLAYRQAALADPVAYIDGKIDPPEGRKPKRGD